MFENTEIWNLNALCRCCHKDGIFKSLEDTFVYQNEVEVYGQMLRDTFDLIIHQPLLEASNTICEECIVRLRDACEFKKKVQDCERKFEVYCKNELATRPNEPIKTELDSDNDHSMACNDDGFEVEIEAMNPQVSPKKEEHDLNDVKNIKCEDTEDHKPDIARKIKSDSLGKEQKKPVKKTIKREKKKTKYDSSLEIHVKTESGILYSCKICAGSYTQHKDIKHHIIMTHIPKYQCKTCERKFQTKTDFTEHKREHKNIFKCDYCDKEFVVKASLKAHVNQHTRAEIFKCDICSKEFTYKSTLRVHLRGHAGTKKRYICHLCGWAFNDTTNLRKHIEVVHEKKRPYPCDICPKTFTAKKHLIAHIKMHNGELSYECKDCPKKYAVRSQLHYHIKTAHSINVDKYVCKVCGKRWAIKTLFLRHVRYAHVGKKPHKCYICQKDFTCKYSMKRHEAQHSGERPWQCDQCHVSFFQKGTLVRHVERKHGPEKQGVVKEKCEVCHKNVPDIKKHMLCHTNKRFSCEYCYKGFSENKTLTRHKKEVHLNVKPHACQYCDKKYLKMNCLKNHQMKVHKIVSKVENDEDFGSAVAKFSIKNKKGRIKTENGCDDLAVF